MQAAISKIAENEFGGMGPLLTLLQLFGGINHNNSTIHAMIATKKR